MKACGLIVEYNPFHNGHYYHIQQAKKTSNADCIITIMSGNFLQRGEPAIMDKFSRAKAALMSGADIVLELPYAYAVQNSDHFANGAVQTLHAIGVSSICFGSESGEIKHFINSYHTFQEKAAIYETTLKQWLDGGFSFPEASMHAYRAIGLTTSQFDLSQPNNILGYSYVKAILNQDLDIEPLTIERHNNHYHQQEVTSHIASATSIRKELFSKKEEISTEAQSALPEASIEQLRKYKEQTGHWHNWEYYFPLLNYRVQTMSAEELQSIHGVTEGLEHRVKKTAKTAENMQTWIEQIKTRRYTWTRIQRMFVHILTNTKKTDVEPFLHSPENIPYIRLLGMTKTGQQYLNGIKKDLDIPVITALSRSMHPMLQLEEKAAAAYYSILNPSSRKKLAEQELTQPVIC